jgi:predicted lipase
MVGLVCSEVVCFLGAALFFGSLALGFALLKAGFADTRNRTETTTTADTKRTAVERVDRCEELRDAMASDCNSQYRAHEHAALTA